MIIRTATPLTSSDAAHHFGFEFRVTADTAIIEGASVTMSGGTSFSPTNAGGSIDLDIGQAGRDVDNITINLFNDNSPAWRQLDGFGHDHRRPGRHFPLRL